ncbi:MAG: sigma-70 family RNA polymerase sigma factor [Acidobacteria bacterium]|nr:MAG: sigma-70 family RNA polymerase sigma factor [Acidobacteriota bacterium]
MDQPAQPDAGRGAAGSGDVTALLARWNAGDPAACDRLLEAIYGELRQLAAAYLRRERNGHTLETAALVNEAYLRLVDQRRVRWRNRSHFFGIAAQAMRRVLVDHARRKRYRKRGGDRRRLALDEVCELPVERAAELIALDDALRDLAALDPEQARIVELRYFAGLTLEEIAELFGCTVRTVSRRWRMARAWLYRQLAAEDGDGDEP